MLFVLFNVKKETYAVDARDVVEVVPMVKLRSIPKAPNYVAGLLNYRGEGVPVLDLCMMFNNAPCAATFASRMLLVKYRARGGGYHILGLLAESVTDTMSAEMTDFRANTVANDSAQYLREVTTYRDTLVQRIDVNAVIPSNVQSMLFQ